MKKQVSHLIQIQEAVKYMTHKKDMVIKNKNKIKNNYFIYFIKRWKI